MIGNKIKWLGLLFASLFTYFFIKRQGAVEEKNKNFKEENKSLGETLNKIVEIHKNEIKNNVDSPDTIKRRMRKFGYVKKD